MITLILNIILIPIYSYVGSAIATLAAYALMAYSSYLLGSKYYPIPYNIPKISFYIVFSVALNGGGIDGPPTPKSLELTD